MRTKAAVGVAVAVAATVATSTVAFAVSAPNVNVNVSCQADMHLDITYPEAPTGEWTIVVHVEGQDDVVLVDQDNDLMGFHPVIAAGDLPQDNYSYSVDAYLDGDYFTDVFTGAVVCTTEPSPDPDPSISPFPIPTVSPLPPDPDPTTDPDPDPTTDPDGGGITGVLPDTDTADPATPSGGDPSFTG